jgi:hypothetical protein
MTTSDIAELIGYIVAAWCLGFTGGYLFTQIKRAIDAVT